MEADGETATAVGCPSETAMAGKASACEGCPGQALCRQQGGPDPDQERIDLRMNAIKHKILVVSGKGGVGKSSVAAALSLALSQMRKKVGLVDVDICGPSVPKLMKVEGKEVVNSQYGWMPLTSPHGDVKVMSVGSLLQKDDNAVVWRGPRKTAMIKRFLKDTFWGRLDFLVFDTPPGTSDEHLTVVKVLKKARPDGVVIVTTPQEVSLATIRKEINFCQKMGVHVLGMVENMSGFVCPHCQECSELFSSGGAERLAEEYGLKFLGKIPVDQSFKCKYCGTNYCKACRRGDFYGEMFTPDTCRICNQHECQGERIPPPTKPSVISNRKEEPNSNPRINKNSCSGSANSNEKIRTTRRGSVQTEHTRLRPARLAVRRASKS